MRKIGKRYAASTWSWKAGVPGGAMWGATTRPAPARVAPVAASEKTAIARRRRIFSKRIRPAFASRWCPNRLHRRLGRALAADPHDGRVGEVGAETLLRA